MAAIGEAAATAAEVGAAAGASWSWPSCALAREITARIAMREVRTTFELMNAIGALWRKLGLGFGGFGVFFFLSFFSFFFSLAF